MEIWFYRHGMTDANRSGKYIGRTDEPLCPAGAAQLTVVSRQVKRVYVSPLDRAKQTAQILFPLAQQVEVKGLQEMDFGVFEGKNFAQLEHNAAYRAWVESGCEAPCPGGESKQQFTKRTADAFGQLVDEAFLRQEEQLFVVAHGGSIMAALSQFCLPRKPYFEWQTPNGGAWRLNAIQKEWKEQRVLRLLAGPSQLDRRQWDK